MRLILLEEDERPARPVGAVVIRAAPDGGVFVELGPADGAPLARLILTHGEAVQMGEFVRAAANGRNEVIILSEE
jgi:hypothetical protein